MDIKKDASNKIETGDVVFLTNSEVAALMPPMEKTIKIIEETLIAHSERKTKLPSKSILSLEDRYKGRLIAMPAYVELNSGASCGLKWVSSYAKNNTLNLPAVTALIVLNSPQTGIPYSIMDGTLITANRTGAASAVAAKYLFGKNSMATLTIVGASVQGYYQLIALKEVLNFKKIFVFDINKDASQKFRERILGKINGVDIIISDNCKKAVKDSDVIVTSTRALEPFLEGNWCYNAKLVISIGAVAEVRYSFIQLCSKIIVDSIDSVSHLGSLKPYIETGKLSVSDIYAEIGDVVSGKKPIDKSEKGTIFFVPMGMGIEDVSLANFIYKKALGLNIGTLIKNVFF